MYSPLLAAVMALKVSNPVSGFTVGLLFLVVGMALLSGPIQVILGGENRLSTCLLEQLSDVISPQPSVCEGRGKRMILGGRKGSAVNTM